MIAKNNEYRFLCSAIICLFSIFKLVLSKDEKNQIRFENIQIGFLSLTK